MKRSASETGLTHSRKGRIHRDVEQPELHGLLKLVGKPKLVSSSSRRKVTGHNAAEENFWRACEKCSSERCKLNRP